LIEGSVVGIDLVKSAAIKKLYREQGTFTEGSLNGFIFQSRGITERPVPIVNRKMLASITTEIPLPDDETLIYHFADFLLERYRMKGTLEMAVKVKEKYR
jgi:hypothetical protein